MDVSEYRSLPHCSYSKLKAYLKSPLHGATQEQPTESASMRFGTAVDLLIKNQGHVITVNPHEDGRTKAAKEFKEQHAGSSNLILTQNEFNKAIMCVESITKHVGFRKLNLEPSFADVPLIGEFEGIGLKGLPDWLCPSMIVDLKTTSLGIEKHLFAKTIDNSHYDLQAAVYAYLSKKETIDFYWVAVESEKPFDVVVYRATQDIFDVGFEKLKKAISNLKLSTSKPVPDGICSDIQDILMPAWYGNAIS